MNKPTRNTDESYSPIGQFAHDNGIPGVKHDFGRHIIKEGKKLFRFVSDKRIGQVLTQGHIDELEALEEVLRLGGHPDSAVRVVWCNSKGQPVKYWKPGMGSRQKKVTNAERMAKWMRGQ